MPDIPVPATATRRRDVTVAAPSTQSVIDSLTAHVALVDATASIVAVNKAWRRFADANGGGLPNHGIGCNYLHLLDGMADCPCDDPTEIERAARIAEGLRAVLAGTLPRFQMEYPCDSPTERRWFLLTITPVEGDSQVRATVSHEDLTLLKRAQEEAVRQGAELAAAYQGIVDAIALFVEKRDPYTAGHQHQVARIADGIGRILDLDEDRRRGLLLGAIIHDIGKIAVPAEILVKPGRLSDPELQIIRFHPAVGADIVAGVNFPWPLADMVRHHHERLDGTGYPDGLAGDAICLEARIIAVADVYDAIVSHRPYRPARDPALALEELTRGGGAAYDQTVVRALRQWLEEEGQVGAA